MGFFSRRDIGTLDMQLDRLKERVDELMVSCIENKAKRIMDKEKISQLNKEIEHLRNENFRLQQIIISKNEAIRQLNCSGDKVG